jgi:hypothetical protein
MRSISLFFLALAAVTSGPAAAQNWQEYSYPDYSITVVFPAEPQVETTAYPVADGRSVEAHVFSARQNDDVFKVTVAELANSGLDENAVINHAIKTLSEGGELKFNIAHRIDSVYGRQLSILQADGRRSTAALFDYKGRLYQIEGTAPAGGSVLDTLRFQQSLVFTDGGSNRSEEQIRGIRQACNVPPDSPPDLLYNPAGLDDPRCAPPGTYPSALPWWNRGDHVHVGAPFER